MSIDVKDFPSTFEAFRQSIFARLSPPFISTIVYWSEYQSSEILVNRIQLLDLFTSLLQFLKKPENRPKHFSFRFKGSERNATGTESLLLANIFDGASQDRVTVRQSRLIEIVSEPVMLQRLYYFLEDFMIKPILQLWSSGVLSNGSSDNNSSPLLISLRTFESLIASYLKFFRLSERSGLVNLQFREESSQLSPQQQQQLRLNALTERGQELLQTIRSIRAKVTVMKMKTLPRSSTPSLAPPPAAVNGTASKKRPRGRPSRTDQSPTNGNHSKRANYNNNSNHSNAWESSSSSDDREEEEGGGKLRKRQKRHHHYHQSEPPPPPTRSDKGRINLNLESLASDHFWFETHPSIGSRVARLHQRQASLLLRAKEDQLAATTNTATKKKRGKLRKASPVNNNSPDWRDSSEDLNEIMMTSEEVSRWKAGIVMGEIINCGRCPSSSLPRATHTNTNTSHSHSPHSNTSDEEEAEEVSHVYQVQWEDASLEFLTETDYDHYLQFYDQYYGWQRSGHESIGRQVAKYFYLPSTDSSASSSEEGDNESDDHYCKKKRETKKVFFGVITKYAPPEEKTTTTTTTTPDSPPDTNNPNSHEGELFHVVWDDGDHEDLDYSEYQQARSLYQSMKVIRQRQKPSPERKKQMLLSPQMKMKTTMKAVDSY